MGCGGHHSRLEDIWHVCHVRKVTLYTWSLYILGDGHQPVEASHLFEDMLH